MADKRQEQFESLMTRLGSLMPADAVAQLKTSFEAAPEAALMLGEGFLAKEDYGRVIREASANRDALAQERAQVADLAKKVNDYDQHLQSAYLPRDQFEQVTQERNLLQAQLDQLKTAYPQVVEDLGLTPIGGNSQMNNQQQNQNGNGNGQHSAPPAPVQSPIRNVSEPFFNQQMQQAQALAVLTPAALHDLSVKHQQLFGSDKPLTNMTALVNQSLEQGKTLEQVWAETYDVPAQITKLENDRIEQLVQQRTESEVAKRIGQAVVGGATGLGQNGQVGSLFLRDQGQPMESRQLTGAPDMTRIANQGSGHSSTVQKATEAYLSGKYKDAKFDILSRE
jgi:hypothetical protein